MASKATAQITSPYFCAGVVFNKHMVVVEAAPIIKYMKGWFWADVVDYCNKKGWDFYTETENSTCYL